MEWTHKAVIVILVSVFFQYSPLTAQEPDTVLTVDTVVIHGNKLTRSTVILREMEVISGAKVPVAGLKSLLDQSRENIFNTHLFNFVTVDTVSSGIPGRVRVIVSLVERWYIWPIPFLQISDRNFNAWWETRDFSKITYGVDLTFFNVRGRNETLRLLAHFGFNQKYGFTYRIPWLNPGQTLGMGFGGGIELNREIPVMNQDNKPFYYKNSDTMPQQLVAFYIELIYRPGYLSSHTFRTSYNNYLFSDTVLKFPGFSMKDQNRQEFVTFFYMYKTDHRDVQYYPLHGYYFDIQFQHSFPWSLTRSTTLKFYLRKYWDLKNRFYAAAGLTGQLSLSPEHPYYLFKGMGYGRDFVRGYELYVLDAQHYAIVKTNLKYALIPSRVFSVPGIRTSKFNVIPVALYLNLFADAGYAYAPPELASTGSFMHNDLQNRLLGSVGLGLDFTTYYDIVIRLEGSVNLLGKPNFAVHLIAPI